jgi:ATP-grasp ribosomal peptide maturase
MVVTALDDPTADAVIAELNRRGRAEPVRLDPGDFPHSVALEAELDPTGGGWRGRAETSTRSLVLADVVGVYWRRPSPYRFEGLPGQVADFAAVQARLGFGGVMAALPTARYLNHPHRNWAAEYKPVQLSTAAELGFRVPATLITSDVDAVRRFMARHARVLFKPLRITELEQDGQPMVLWAQRVAADELDESVAGTAHLFQAEVDKVADLRITVVGRRVFCVRIESGLLDWRTDYNALTYHVAEPRPGLVDLLLAYLDRFGLEFGCFDFAVDTDGVEWFLECNPNGQWLWLEHATGLPMTAAIVDILEGHPAASGLREVS